MKVTLIILIISIVLFVLYALGVHLGSISLLGWAFVAFAASFLPIN